MLQSLLFHNSCRHEDMLGRCNKLSDDRNVESPGLLRGWNDLISREKEPVEPGVSQLHAGGEVDAIAVSPVCRAATCDVQHAGDAAGLVVLPMDGSQSFRTFHGKRVHGVVVIGGFLLESPREKNQLAVAVNRVVEDKLVLPCKEVVPNVDIFNLGEGFWSVIRVGALVIRGAALVPVETPVAVCIDTLTMENASVIRSRLPPHPVVVPGPVVAIRVGRGKDEPVGVVEQVGNILDHRVVKTQPKGKKRGK